MTSEKFDPSRLPEPDELGFFAHPDIPGNEESDDVAALLGAMGFQFRTVEFELDADDSDVDLWFMPAASATTSDMKAIIERWTPTVPSGDGWILVSKFDTDSGPFALFVKPIQASKGEDQK